MLGYTLIKLDRGFVLCARLCDCSVIKLLIIKCRLCLFLFFFYFFFFTIESLCGDTQFCNQEKLNVFNGAQNRSYRLITPDAKAEFLFSRNLGVDPVD